jgi:predicted TIM-barrel fold metal-dependent hydrolase
MENDDVAKAAHRPTAVAFDVPRGACDCHAHVFCNPQQFSLSPERTYTPEPASVNELRALHEEIHVDRVVLVNSLIYGSSNACLVEALRQLGPRARGIAIIDDQTSDAQLDDLHRAGVRGIRVNLESFGVANPLIARRRFQAAVRRVAGRDWHVQVYSRVSVVQALHDDVMAAPMPVVFDHFAHASPTLGVSEAGFGVLLNLLRAGKGYVKISAAYRISADSPDYRDVTPLVKALVAANPERVLWGTDWPHPDSSQAPGRRAMDTAPPYPVDDARLFNQLPVWVPNERVRRTILVDNPRLLYGF